MMAAVESPAQQMRAPCAGTVTTWRVNIAAQNDTFRLRVIRDNGDGTFTSTASSAFQTASALPGVVVFPTSVPIATGEYLGVDLSDPGAILARNLFGNSLFKPPLVDGTPQAVNGDASVVPLVNADVACSAPAVPAGPTGQRAAALKKCKKKRSKSARSKCRKKASLLPV